AGDRGPADGAPEMMRVVVVAQQGRNDAALDVEILHGVQDESAQDRVRADLDEYADPSALRLRDRVREAHRLADIAPPVGRVERRTVEPFPGNRGIERNIRLAGTQL